MFGQRFGLPFPNSNERGCGRCVAYSGEFGKRRSASHSLCPGCARSSPSPYLYEPEQVPLLGLPLVTEHLRHLAWPLAGEKDFPIALGSRDRKPVFVAIALGSRARGESSSRPVLGGIVKRLSDG